MNDSRYYEVIRAFYCLYWTEYDPKLISAFGVAGLSYLLATNLF